MRTRPSDYATLNLIKYRVAFGKRKTAKTFHMMRSLLSRGEFRQKLENVVKNFLTVVSNSTGFRLFTLNQVIDEVNDLVLTYPGIFCKSNSSKRSY